MHNPNSKLRVLLVTLVFLGLAMANCEAEAALVSYDFTFSIGNSTNGYQTGYGTVVGDDLGFGEFHAVSGTMHWTSDLGDVGGIYSLIPAGPSKEYFGPWTIDNLFYPTRNPTLNDPGFLFGDGTVMINPWGNGPDDYSFGYSVFNGEFDEVIDVRSGGPGTGSFFTFTQAQSSVPEPSSIVAFSLTAAMMGCWSFRHRRLQKA